MSLSTAVAALRVCIVGAGPAGLYTAERLFKRRPGIEIDIVERMPFPFGLVETGVAPDHSETKNVRNGFMRVLQKPNCQFYGNVKLGTDIGVQSLREMYHGVILACGAEVDRKLQIEGEEGKGVMSAREFVWWYNGHPDCSKLDVDLSGVKNVAIIGAGNVALDCARVLLKPWSAFGWTDMASHAVNALMTSSVENVYLIARRGVAHAKFTPKELREIVQLPQIRCVLNPSDLKLSHEEIQSVNRIRRKKRLLSILQSALERAQAAEFNRAPYTRSLHFKFGKQIARIHLSDTTSIQAISLKSNHPSDLQSPKADEILDVDLLISSIGTTSVPIEGLPFDHDNGIVPNIDGRVVDPKSGEIVPGVYVTGWLKRGATGIIGSNIIDAEEVTEAIHHDASILARTTSLPSLEDFLSSKGVRFVRFEDWQKLQAYETQLGHKNGKQREKTPSLEAMLSICLNQTH